MDTTRDRHDLPHGQLWQPCTRRGCETEPVCVHCERCAKHCFCPDPPTEAESAGEAARAQARRLHSAAATVELLARLTQAPADTADFPIQIYRQTGGWDTLSEPSQIARLLDAVLKRETWYAPRVNREALTCRRDLLIHLAHGHEEAYADDWYARIRVRAGE